MNTFLARAGSNSKVDLPIKRHYHMGVCNLARACTGSASLPRSATGVI